MNYAVKEIKDYDGKYAVDTIGEVYTMKNGEWIRMRKRIKKGYCVVRLSDKGIVKERFVHRLVAAAFIGDVQGKVIDHLDANPLNNKVENLRICSPLENNNNPITKQRRDATLREVCSKSLVLRGVTDGSVYKFDAVVDAGKFFGYKNNHQVNKELHKAKLTNSSTISLRKQEFYYQVQS